MENYICEGFLCFDLFCDNMSKSEKKIAQNETFSVISEFLPDPIRDTLSG